MRWLLGAFVGVLGLAAIGCQTQDAPQPDAVAPAGSLEKHAPSLATRVVVARIDNTNAKLKLVLPAEVEAWHDASLAAAMGGYVERVRVTSGDRVRKGQVLALVDSATHGARVRQAKVQVEAAKIELDRAKLLGDALPGAQHDAAKARYNGAKAALATARVAASRAVIRAPFAGTIAKVNTEVGEVAGPGMPLIRLVQLNPIKVTVSLSDRDISSIKVGMDAAVTTEALGAVLKGRVKHIEPAADTRTRAFLAEIEVPNEAGMLLPGMIASVRLIGHAAAADQLAISQDWLVTRPDGLGVFLHQRGKAVWRDVQVGAVIGSKVLVKSGLERGDELVIVGHRELAVGDALWVTRKGVCCRAGRVVFEATDAAGGALEQVPPKAGPATSSEP